MRTFGRFTNSLVNKKTGGGFQVRPMERINYSDIPLSSSWHPEMMQVISGSASGPARATEASIQLSDLTSYTGPSMPGVGLLYSKVGPKVYVDLYSAFTQTPQTRSDMDHTVLPANNTISTFTPSRRASPVLIAPTYGEMARLS